MLRTVEEIQRYSAPAIGESSKAFLIASQDPETRQHTDDAEQIEEVLVKELYRMLNNRVYIGEAVHKGTSYPGEHTAIIDIETWDKVHAILTESPRKRAAQTRADMG